MMQSFSGVGAVGIKAEKKDEGIICVEIPFVPKNADKNVEISTKSIWKKSKRYKICER